MLKRRIIAIVTGLVLLAAAAGISGVAADGLSYLAAPQEIACNSTGGSGGSC